MGTRCATCPRWPSSATIRGHKTSRSSGRFRRTSSTLSRRQTALRQYCRKAVCRLLNVDEVRRNRPDERLVLWPRIVAEEGHLGQVAQRVPIRYDPVHLPKGQERSLHPFGVARVDVRVV